MTRIVLSLLFLGAIIVRCDSNNSSDEIVSENEFYDFFYPFDTIPKVYVYRNETHGMEEEFHRVFSLTDSQGKHTIVETYSSDGRILEALTFNLDSLTVMDHMVVKSDQDRIKTQLPRYDLFPMSKQDSGYLSQIIPLNDTLLLYKETARNYLDELDMKVMDEEKKTVLFSDYISMSYLIKDSEKTQTIGSGASFYYSNGMGLTRWHTDKKEVDFVLKKIISQKEFIELMSLK